MAPLYRCRNMEAAANILVAHFRHVLIRAAYENDLRIRFRADRLKDPRVYFNKVASQHKRWRENGGALITWKNSNLEGPTDAILFVECPKSIDALYRAALNTRAIGVIYMPPTWRPHEEQLVRRHKEKHPAKYRRQAERLEIMKHYVATLPWFNARAVQQLLRARERAPVSQSSFSRGLSSAAALSSDTPG